MVAPWILWRYILRDVSIYTCLGLLVFSLLLVVQNTLRFIDELLSAGVGFSGLMKLVGVILPSYLCYAIPTSLLMGVLLAFGRMSADGEIIAMRASGISVPRLLPPVLALGTLAALVTGYLLFELAPRSHQQMKMLVREMASSSRVAKPGGFREFGDRTVYVDAAGDETCPLKGVLIGDFSDPRRTFYIAARCGSIRDGAESTSLALDLVDGSIHFSESASDRYRKIHFVKMHTEIDLAEYLERGLRVRELTFRELLRYDAEFRRGGTPVIRGEEGHRSVKVQLHRRVAFPFAAVLLTLLSVPLGIRPVRAGRSAGALTAIALMALYWLIFSAGELMAERGWVPPWLGVWTANLLALGVALFLMRLAPRGDS